MSDLPLQILIPVYNDWASAERLVRKLDEVLGKTGRRAEVLFVDDGSTEAPCRSWSVGTGCTAVRQLRLKRNVGHQRAICIGMAHVAEHVPCPAVLVMDGDGEDDPHVVPALLEEFDRQRGERAIFAERRKRSESAFFRAGYFAYRMLHRVLVGQRVRVGNFSVVPWSQVVSLSLVAEMWSHYAAAVLASGCRYGTVPTARGVRYDGKSSMNVTKLIIHGISALTVYNDRISTRLLVASVVLGIAGVIALVALAAGEQLAVWQLPGWWLMAAIGLGTIYLNALGLILLFSSLTLGVRAAGTFLPARDYAWFVDRVETLWPASTSGGEKAAAVHEG